MGHSKLTMLKLSPNTKAGGGRDQLLVVTLLPSLGMAPFSSVMEEEAAEKRMTTSMEKSIDSLWRTRSTAQAVVELPANLSALAAPNTVMRDNKLPQCS